MQPPEEKVIKIEIPNNSNPSSLTKVSATVVILNRKLVSCREAVCVDERGYAIPLPGGLFRQTINVVRNGIRKIGQKQGWLDKHAVVLMPHDQK